MEPVQQALDAALFAAQEHAGQKRKGKLPNRASTTVDGEKSKV
jgi:hypothetical protein